MTDLVIRDIVLSTVGLRFSVYACNLCRVCESFDGKKIDLKVIFVGAKREGRVTGNDVLIES